MLVIWPLGRQSQADPCGLDPSEKLCLKTQGGQRLRNNTAGFSLVPTHMYSYLHMHTHECSYMLACTRACTHTNTQPKTEADSPFVLVALLPGEPHLLLHISFTLRVFLRFGEVRTLGSRGSSKGSSYSHSKERGCQDVSVGKFLVAQT